ncbi:MULTISPECIES: type IV secretory system conjugative DNA transfer family protein [Azotobacter]|uniref:Conjugal transfer coupling protein TraG n=1 Tax=Azotobacter chroococcum NCIMB 8003 TaxID=1328314 RepID=A0A0C4WS60_9GAMM|nr:MULTISPECIES: type IV secretory system conjugative DNA transfer family protein [Azotobacter]AJE23499.1 Conjugal transfer coupling protein TraG [Azotobacter chroococcum NCIMB 8003]MDV7210084.1 type IV secretory system conjugative DNA transfer family protein [Azotobacter beijerinckii]
MISKDKFNNAVGPQVRAKKSGVGKAVPALALLSIGVGLAASTQFFAYDLNYQEVLGPHFNHVYAPWSILTWANKWYGIYPDAFMRAGSIGVLATGVGLLGLVVTKMISANSSKANEYLHGSARWAGKKDIQAAGLLARPRRFLEVLTGKSAPSHSGVYVGAWVDNKGVQHYLRHNGPEHVLTYAPTRSGKGVGLVVPTLLSWSDSTVITDLKGELWALTAGWRQKHARNKVLRFDPASSNGGVRWNPLDEIRIGTENEVGDVQNLATLIVDPDGKGLDSHWQKTSQALLVGLIMHVLYKSKNEGTPATLPEVDRNLADPDRDIGDLWMEMVTYSHVNGRNHPLVGSAARDMMDRPEEEAGSVLSTAKTYLALYRDPVVAQNVSASEFKVKDLMNHDNPVSLYIFSKPNDKARLRPLVRVLINMIVRLLADKMDFENGRPVAHYKHRLLMMLDEFPSLGKLEILQESLAFVAGYGIKCYLICQDINQLKSREIGYGHDETITSNCHVQNAYPPNRVETAEHLSKLTGQTTVVKEQITTSGRRTSALLGQVSRTIQEVQRPLLTPDECLRMPGPLKIASGDISEAGDMVVYVAGYPAIYGKQPLYFKDPVFQTRAAIPAPKNSDKLRIVQEVTAAEAITI